MEAIVECLRLLIGRDLFAASISTGGAAMNAIIKTEVAVNKVGIIKTPNHPM
jgi:hypothetical protein